MNPSTTHPIPERLVGTKTLASILQVSDRWVRHQAQRGALPHFQLAGVRRFDLEEILALMRQEPAVQQKA